MIKMWARARPQWTCWS